MRVKAKSVVPGLVLSAMTIGSAALGITSLDLKAAQWSGTICGDGSGCHILCPAGKKANAVCEPDAICWCGKASDKPHIEIDGGGGDN